VSHSGRCAAGAALLALALAAACAGPAPRPAGQAAPLPPPLAHGRYGAEPAAASTPLERSALEVAARRLAPSRPRPSAALTLAARALAEGAAGGARDPLSRVRLRLALAAALAFDPAPVAHLVEADPDRATEALAGRVLPAEAPFTHAGAGAVVRGGRVYLVLLLSRRQAALRPFPRDVAVRERATLRGKLVGLTGASVHLTAPSGESRDVPASADGASFAAPIDFDVPGRWQVEVVGTGARGPQVAALLTVACGGVPLGVAAEDDERDPADPGAAEERVVAAINATRGRQGLPPLESDRQLAEVARRHSEQMLRAGVLAHVLPGSAGPAERLRAARVPFAVALENVALGESAIAAHRAAEDSPAHRQNILTRQATRIGCGIARGRMAGGEPAVYLTELFVRPVEDGTDDSMTPEARVREALWRERARGGTPALVSDARLDALARDAAREMARRGEPAPGDAAARALAFGRKIAAVDAFLGARASDAARSRNLADPRFGRVGVGVAVGDSAVQGRGMLFIAVVYTD
jgi:uncharacterized protein YkwD